MPEKIKILVSGGGTGGHIFPAIAIAKGLQSVLKNADILFVGANGRMEMEKVPQAGFPIRGLWISGLQRKFDLSNLSFPFKVISSLRESSKIIKKHQAVVAIGTGGYASGPLLYMATRKKIPTLILEQNSYPGITNKLLGKSVSKVCVAYDGMEKYFPKEKITITGSPIRKEILDLKPVKKEGLEHFNMGNDKPTLLIIGGSQGAYRMNTAIAAKLDKIMKNDIQMIWQTGTYSFTMAKEVAEKSDFNKNIRVVDFITEMDMAYAAADFIISRAGAIAIAEIIAVKKPAIFIPLPSAAEDHQTKNAQTLVDGKAALLVKENDAEQKLPDTISYLIDNKQEQKTMVKNMKKFEHPDATKKIVDEILKLINQ